VAVDGAAQDDASTAPSGVRRPTDETAVDHEQDHNLPVPADATAQTRMLDEDETRQETVPGTRMIERPSESMPTPTSVSGRETLGRPTAAAGTLSMADLEILGELGGGGQATVYRAYDRRRGHVVALKVLPRTSPSALYRFKQEFRTLAGVTHPNLVTLYELFSDGQQWSFTMELIAGVDLLAAVRPDTGAGRNLDVDRLREGFRHLAEGVVALHDAGHVHRDLKPNNVLVTKEGRVVILDMGIAAELDRGGLHQSTEPQLIGTVPYMSPEQSAGHPVSSASDWYSVGVMLYEALTGVLPFRGEAFTILLDKQRAEPPAPRTLAPEIPEDLDRLCVDLLRRDATDRPSDRDVLRRLGSTAARGPTSLLITGPKHGEGRAAGAPLIGREPHLEALGAAFEAVKQGRTVVCSVHGRSGVGKSVLIEQFVDACSADADTVVLAGRCYEQESVPYKAFDSLVDALSRYLRRLPRWEAEALLPRDVQLLGRVFPVLRRVAAVGEAPHRALESPPDQQQLRQRAFSALRELLARLGDRKSVVLAIDDLQWADVDSAALLGDLFRPPDPPTLLLLACYRSEETASPPFVQALSAISSTIDRRELAVEPLSLAQSSALARTLVGQAIDDSTAAAAVDVEAIARESGGNPFYVAELVNFVRALGTAGVSDSTPSAALPSPTVALDEVLWSRIVGLPEAARRLLEVVAVSGQPLTQTAACRAVALGQDERTALAMLRSGRLIRSTSTGSGEREVIETYHDRVRETVVNHLPPATREDCHHRLARVLLDSGETDPETLAVHFQGAGQPDRAAAYFASAADQAAEALAFDRAAKLYRLALDLQPPAGASGPDSEDSRLLRTKLGDALANAGRGGEAAREYLAARAGTPMAGAIELERKAAMQFLISGHVDQGIAVLRNVLHAVDMSLPESPASALRTLLLGRLWLRLRGLGFRERAPGAVAALELSRIDICWAAVAGLSLVNPITAAAFQTQNLLLALRAGEPYRVARALAMQAFHSASAGGRTRGRSLRLLDAADRLAQRVGHPHALGMVALASAVAAYCVGRWKEAHAACEQAAEIFRSRCTGVAWELTTARLISLPSLIWMGEHAEAYRRLHLYRQEALERGELYGIATIGAFCVHEHLAADEPDQARRDLTELIGIWSRQGFHMQHMEQLWMGSHIELYCQEGAAAWDLMTRQWPDLERSLLMRVQLIRIGMRHLRARCALAKAVSVSTGERGPYLASAERDARRVERERMAWGRGLALLIRAGVATGRGDRAQAIAWLDAAVVDLEANDMRYPAAVARRRLGELKGGAEGRALIDDVNAWMSAQKIRDPDRFAAMLAPGFPG
jgi:tetratricopeptide (TPR) repeat protein